jgi:hypothetical protein
MSSIFCQAGGISMRSALGKSTPPVTSISSILSRLDESDPDSFTNGVTLCKSGSSLDWSLGCSSLGPVSVSLDGIDLAVVGEHPKRLR